MPKGRRVGGKTTPAPQSGGGVSSPASAPALYNPVYDALTSRGLVLPLHSGLVGSSIASDNFYDRACPELATRAKGGVVSDDDEEACPERVRP
jgi:hypothetical protein